MKRDHQQIVAERLGSLARRFKLAPGAAERLGDVLVGLAAEPAPPTGVKDPAEAVDLHIGDSLVALDLPAVRRAPRVADVGSGAGFPGLPLAIALPNTAFDLIEASRRKCELIDRLARACGAANVRAVPDRAEAWAVAEGHAAYDVVTARAVAPLAVLAEYAAPLLRVGGSLVAWKGRRDPAEEEGAAAACEALGMRSAEVRRVEPFARARERHLHVLVKHGPTPARFPRRPGRAAKRPLG